MATRGQIRTAFLFDEIFDCDVLCSMCRNEGRNTEGEKYCVDCDDYFCVSCVKVHSKVPLCAYHKVLDKSQVESGTSNAMSRAPAERCNRHSHKHIDMYCQNHDNVGCSICMAVDHRLCKDTFYIPEFIQNITNKVESRDIQTKLKEIAKTLGKQADRFKQDKQRLLKRKAEILADIRKFRQEINDQLDKLEKSSIDEIESKVKCLEDKIEEGLKQLQANKSRIISANDKLASTNTSHSEVFVYVKMGEDAANVANKYMEHAKIKSTVEDIEFQPDRTILTQLEQKETIGILSEKPTKTADNLFQIKESSIESTPWFNEGTEEVNWELQGNKKLNKNSLQAACQQYGIHSQEINTLTKEICHDIQAGSENIVKVWPAYRENDKNDVIFVVVTNKHVDSSTEINYNHDFEIVLRQKLETNDEDMLVNKHEFNTNAYIDDAKNKEIKAVIKKYSHTLRKQHSELTMICASSVKSSGFLSGKPSMESENCIVLYVHIKGYIPLQEYCFPKMLDGFPVDVRENVFQMYGNKKPSDYCQNLKMGCEIGQNHIEGYGTIGGFIEHENHGLCLMTCSHIFLDPEGLRKNQTPLIICNQPSFKKGIGEKESIRCGELKFHKVGTVTEGKACVDVAFVKIDTLRQPVNGTFPSISSEDLMKSGFDKDYIPEYTSGKVYNTDEIIQHKRNRFIKYGATTLLRQGRYHSDGAFVILFGEITLVNQIKIIDMDLDFAAEGDSGALVFCKSDEGLVAAGLLEGGGKGYTIMTPICDILHAVGYSPPYALKTFPDANDNINGKCRIQKNSEQQAREEKLLAAKMKVASDIEAEKQESIEVPK